MIKILFVCVGNICRSPALEASLKKKIEERGLSTKIHVESCGLNPLFLHSKADPFMKEAAEKRGIVIDTRAKLFQNPFFEDFDLIFAVNHRILDALKLRAQGKKHAEKVHLVTEFSKRFLHLEIPDPYMGKREGFEQVMEMIEEVSEGILDYLEGQV